MRINHTKPKRNAHSCHYGTGRHGAKRDDHDETTIEDGQRRAKRRTRSIKRAPVALTGPLTPWRTNAGWPYLKLEFLITHRWDVSKQRRVLTELCLGDLKIRTPATKLLWYDQQSIHAAYWWNGTSHVIHQTLYPFISSHFVLLSYLLHHG